jgi:hypothetical protein
VSDEATRHSHRAVLTAVPGVVSRWRHHSITTDCGSNAGRGHASRKFSIVSTMIREIARFLTHFRSDGMMYHGA